MKYTFTLQLTSSCLNVGLSTYLMTSSDRSSTSYPSGKQYTCGIMVMFTLELALTDQK